jgi:hypothetical protein
VSGVEVTKLFEKYDSCVRDMREEGEIETRMRQRERFAHLEEQVMLAAESEDEGASARIAKMSSAAAQAAAILAAL